MWKYLWWFIGGAVGLSILWAVMDAILPGDSGGTTTAGGVLVPFLSANIAVDRFVANHMRVPDKAERWWLVLWSFGALLAWSVIGFVVLAVLGVFEGVDTGVFAVILVVAVAVTFLSVWGGYAFWPKRVLRNHERQAQRRATKAD
ncbi:hypothetical protein nbrc107697_03600 [Gordonia crocea]|uniref:Transmembrane protein n=2 Tax=Gordonia crocea TaxID=589162 RepID=A0A7M3SUJ7_9ACTN|nr:hypothetical protein nbrc107697_03600 [Gordonia crocea]